ncbi:hypothetical protein ACI1TW_10055 [Lactococcus garvieae]|uniref:hypothetical protein n=1 Tax=Lactococcus garvieae TaxID=1363 RepID=UPI0038535431
MSNLLFIMKVSIKVYPGVPYESYGIIGKEGRTTELCKKGKYIMVITSKDISKELTENYLKLKKINKVTPQTKEIKNIVELFIDDTLSKEQNKKFTDHAQDMLALQFNKDKEDNLKLTSIEDNLSKLKKQIIGYK